MKDTTTHEAKVIPTDQWADMVAGIEDEGNRMAAEFKEQGRTFVAQILGPATVRGGDEVPLQAVTLPLDWKVAARLEMVQLAREFVSKAYLLGTLDKSLLAALASAIEGKPHHPPAHEPNPPGE